MTPADLQHLEAKGFQAATVKGNPSKVHAKKPGLWKAACGKEPGPSRPYSGVMRKRSGWFVYKTPPMYAALCENCAKALE